jgi:hypothetical protein
MYDFHFDRPVSDCDLRAVLCATLALTESDIAIIRSLNEIDPNETFATYVVRTVHGGEFAHTLEIYPKNCMDHANLPSETELATQFAARLHCRCLISDDSPNPYTWILVTPMHRPDPSPWMLTSSETMKD